jgi:hypothetical protein
MFFSSWEDNNKLLIPVLWIRNQIGSGFNDFVDADPDPGERQRCKN